MKKLSGLLLAILLVMGSISFASAEENGVLNSTDEQKLEKELRMTEGRVAVLKSFVDEYHQINQLKRERLALRITILEKHDTIIDLYITAKENGNTEALKQAKEVRAEITVINEEIKALAEQVKVENSAFRQALKNKDMEKAQIAIDNVISLLKTINDKVNSKITLLDKTIEILSDEPAL